MADNIPVEGNLDLKGNQVKNVAIEVVTTLPTANNNFIGRQVTYQGRSYIWDGSAWKCDSDYLEIGGRNLLLDSEKEKRANSTILNTPFDYSRMVGEGFFTISLEAKINSGDSGKFDFYFRSNASVGNVSPTKTANQDWERFSHTWELTRTQIETILTITVRTSAYQSDILIRNIKIEKGNIATDWTPAPEDKANNSQSVNYALSSEQLETTTIVKDTPTLWQNIFSHTNFLWGKLKDLFSPIFLSVNDGYLTKIDDVNKKLVKSNIYDDGTNVGIGTTTLSEKLQVDGNVKANGYKVGSGTDTKLLTDGGGTKLITDFAALENGKIKASNLPDYLLGQVLYGGSINSSQTCTLSSLYKDKFDTTDITKLLSNLNASSHVGVYFIASESFMLNGTIDVQTGDWVISDGNTWGKIDNTDAVASVNNKTGVVNLGYEDLGDMPEATDTEVGGIMLGFVGGLDADLLDGKHASDFADVNHTHEYSLLDNLPAIYNADHAEVQFDDFDVLYDEPNDVWLCNDSMRNGPLDDNGGTDTSYNNFEHCVVQQFGDRRAGTKVQVLYITTGNVANLIKGFGSIFYRIQHDKWKRIVTYSDIANLQSQINNQINNLTTTVNNKQDKLSILTDINIPSDGIATINPIGNKVYNVNLSGTTSWHTINLGYLNSLDEVSIIINNPNNAGRIAINQDALYKFVGVFPDFSINSWIITIWKGLIFTNIIGG